MVQLKEEIGRNISSSPYSGKRSSKSPIEEQISPKRRKYVNFTTSCLDFIHSSVDENKQCRYTKVGNRKNMIFSLVGNENKLMKTMLYGHGFAQGSPDNRFYNLAWSSSFISGHKMKNMKPWQRLNQFPRLKQLTFKDELYSNIARSASQYGEPYNFIPESFIVPRDKVKLEEAFIRNNENSTKPVQYIVKPTHSSEGKGIFFITKPEELPEKKLLVSRYIEKPFLVNGHKFDLRIYAAVTSIYPLIVYLYSEGLTRFASSEYSEEIGEMASFVHLTNYSLNKTSVSYVRNESLTAEDHGHKWTLGALLRYLENQGHDSKLLMLRIEDLVTKTFLSVQSTIASVSRNTILNVGSNFHLFGFDILIDEKLKPWLLEVNLNPSLATDAPLDLLLKPQMIADLLNLVCVPQVDPSVDLPEEKIKVLLKRYGPRKLSNNLRFMTENAIERRVQEYRDRLALEEQRRGNFVRIFPRENSFDLYKGIMEASGPENYDFRLYESYFGSQQPVSDSIAQIYHNFMGNQTFSNFSLCPSPVKKLISNWHKETSLYVQKITEDGMNYRASLPIVRKTARLRTNSYSSYLRKKKELLEFESLQLQKQKISEKENIDPLRI